MQVDTMISEVFAYETLINSPEFVGSQAEKTINNIKAK